MSEAERQRKMAQALEAKRIEMERQRTSAPSAVTAQASKQGACGEQPADVPSVSDVEVACLREESAHRSQRNSPRSHARHRNRSINRPRTVISQLRPNAPATLPPIVMSKQSSALETPRRMLNVFAEVRTEVVRPTDQQKRRRKRDRTGGGRQPQRKRLDARKETEFRSGLRRLLYDESRSIDEVHCSNIEGQVWSRGSRQSVEAAVEYLNEKAEDAIIPEDLRDEIARLIREFTTRR